MGYEEGEDLEIVLPQKTKKLLQEYKKRCSRSLGQNFLVDSDVLSTVMGAAGIEQAQNVVEIGPGLGALTEAILQKIPDGRLLTVEKDEELVEILHRELGDFARLEIIRGDALEIDWEELLTGKSFVAGGYILMANLPYYITSPLIRTFLEMKYTPREMILMVQKEVAERITASPGGKEYGILSIAVQYYCHPEIIDIVPPTAFFPQPEVESAILRLDLRRGPNYEVDDEELFFDVVRAMFQQRRKMLRNSLSKAKEIDLDKDLVKRALERSDIDERLRGEKLSLERIVRLSNVLNKMLAGNGDD